MIEGDGGVESMTVLVKKTVLAFFCRSNDGRETKEGKGLFDMS